MNQTLIDKLERIKYRSTLYELVCNDEYLAGYCKHGKNNILQMLRKNGDAWAARINKDDTITFNRNGRSVKIGSLNIAFSGRTQRDAIINGELPWFEELPTVDAL